MKGLKFSKCEKIKDYQLNVKRSVREMSKIILSRLSSDSKFDLFATSTTTKHRSVILFPSPQCSTNVQPLFLPLPLVLFLPYYHSLSSSHAAVVTFVASVIGSV